MDRALMQQINPWYKELTMAPHLYNPDKPNHFVPNHEDTTGTIDINLVVSKLNCIITHLRNMESVSKLSNFDTSLINRITRLLNKASNIDFTNSTWIDDCQEVITKMYSLYDKYKDAVEKAGNLNAKRTVEQFKDDLETLKLEIHKPYHSNKRDINNDYATDLTIDEIVQDKKGHKDTKKMLENYSPFIASNLPLNFNLQGILKNYIQCLSYIVDSDIYDKLDITAQNTIKDVANYLSEFSKSNLIRNYKSAKDAYMGVRMKINSIIESLENYAKHDRVYKFRILEYTKYLREHSKEIGDIVHWVIEYNPNNTATITKIKNNFFMSKPWSWRWDNRVLDNEFNNKINKDGN